MAAMSDQTPLPLELPVVDAEPRERADAQRNRSKVLCAAEGLIAEHGVENVSMDAIAAAAGVGKGTLFRRFGDRAGLAAALLQDQTSALQEALIRGPAPLGPGAPPQERLKAMARAQIALMEDHAQLIAAADSGPPGSMARSAPNQFLRTHIGILIREADPDADYEMLADLLLAPLTAESFLYWCRAREQDTERLLALFDTAVDRLFPS
jgi:AcrR family transcriptional regulator